PLVSIIGTDGRPTVRGGLTRDQAVLSSPSCVCAARCLGPDLAYSGGRTNARDYVEGCITFGATTCGRRVTSVRDS
ncbi:MAG: hypothetical protein LC799_26440, partial [Actinobacteria bacterium]|nr:hypothetical protein [Actinomycetota bacterium]